ncbi:MAG: hypothetical protein AAGF27_09315 [Pseudomonadota bacterium]
MTDLGLRYNVGITSVLRRCVVAGVLAVCTPLAAAANLAETSSMQAALSLIERFETVCAQQVEQGEIGDKSGLISLSADKIESLAAALGFPKQPDAVWTDQDAQWYQVQPSLDAPEICLFVSFEIALEDMKDAWNFSFRGNDKWQSYSDAVVEVSPNTAARSVLNGAHALRQRDDEILFAGAGGMQLQETGIVLLRYQKKKSAPDNAASAGGGD